MAQTAKVINRQLDQAVLAQMNEPITVSVSRVMGSQRSPLVLPIRPEPEGYGPGEGWEKRNVQDLEGWLVTDFAGGGLYNIRIVDSGGLTYEWQPYFDPKTYPPRIPETMQSSMMNMPVQQQPTQSMAPQPEWPPRVAYGTPIATPIHSQVPMTFPPYTYGFPTRQVSSADEDRRRFEDEKRTMSERLAQLERERLEEKHRADLQAVRADNDRKFEELKQSLAPKTDDALARRLDKMDEMFSRMIEKMSAAPTGPSPEFRALEEQNRQLAARLDAEKRDALHASAMASLERKIEDMNRRPTGPDPMFTMLVDAMKDNGRNLQSVMDGMQRQMLTPEAVLNLAKSTSSGLDDLRTGVVRTFQEIFELQKRAFESAAQMLPQGESPAVRIIEGTIEKAGEAFEKWQGSKDAAQVAQAKAVTAQAKTQEAAINAQRSQLEEMARREEFMRQQQAAAAPPRKPIIPENVPPEQPALGGGLSGPAISSVAVPAPTPTNGTNGTNVIPFKPSTDERRLGKTDFEWFKGALPHVERLRLGVYEFIASVSASPPTLDENGKPKGIDPEQAASFILQSTATIVQQGLEVPAFPELFLADRFDDFAMILLPHAPQQYRAEMIRVIKLAAEQQEEVEDDDDEDDDDDDDDERDEDGDDKEDEAKVPPPKSSPPKPARHRQPRA